MLVGLDEEVDGEVGIRVGKPLATALGFVELVLVGLDEEVDDIVGIRVGNPLAAILGFTELLLVGLDEEEKDKVDGLAEGGLKSSVGLSFDGSTDGAKEGATKDTPSVGWMLPFIEG